MKKVNELKSTEKLVVVFDFCSSSDIIEELTLSNNLFNYCKLLLSIQSFLQNGQRHNKWEVYKYLGDGWIVLFEKESKPKTILSFLNNICSLYASRHKTFLKPKLSVMPKIIGVTFGIELGRIYRFSNAKNKEYFGRAINIASRLQSAIKDGESSPQYKALITRQVYTDDNAMKKWTQS